MVPYGSDVVTLMIELNQTWPEGAPAGIEDELEYWLAPGGLYVPPEWRLLAVQVIRAWVQALKEARRLKLGGHTYEVMGDTAVPQGQRPELILYEDQDNEFEVLDDDGFEDS